MCSLIEVKTECFVYDIGCCRQIRRLLAVKQLYTENIRSIYDLIDMLSYNKNVTENIFGLIMNNSVYHNTYICLINSWVAYSGVGVLTFWIVSQQYQS